MFVTWGQGVILLTIDPGLIYPAAAVFKNGLLVAASRVKIPGTSKLAIAARCDAIAIHVVQWYKDNAVVRR